MLTCTVSALLLVTYFAVASSHRPSRDPLVVKTAHGYLRGSILTSRKGRTIYSYRGIRFAKPPVGDLRFKAPQPLDPWDGVRNATEDGFGCLQPPESELSFPTSEDCLFLNVYTTKLPNNHGNPNRSVFVFFHPGGWIDMTGISLVFGPQYLMDQDIVLVTTNYRLGALGFLSTGDDVLPGNYGMKDHVATLRWVQQNIAAFGGNPNSVTIGGYSAGGANALFLMVSPMSRGLFHRVISMSPAFDTFWDVMPNPLMQAKRQAGFLNCPNDTSKQIADCLRQKDAQEITNGIEDMYEWDDTPTPFKLAIEQESTGERFLTESPMKTLLDGNFISVPYLTGMTKDEFDVNAYYVISNKSWAEDMYNNFDRVSPIVFEYERGTKKSLHVSRIFKELYLNNQPITQKSFTGVGNLISDAAIRYGQDLMSKVIANISTEPVYNYQFEYQGRYSFAYWPGTQRPYGVSHHDDLIYLFYVAILFPEFKPEDPEIQMVEKLTKMWANFIQTGNPTPKREPLLSNVVWRKMTPKRLNYLSIGSQLKMKEGMFQDRLTVWDRLFPPQ